MGLEEKYPDLQPAVPINETIPSRTVRILTPQMVLATVLLLAASSISGTTVAAVCFLSMDRHSMSVGAAQASILAASSCSIVYLLLHILAMFHNEPVGTIRPPVVRVHGYCFVVARIALVLWMIAITISSVALSREKTCLAGCEDCTPSIIAVIVSNCAFLAVGILLTALEACQYPFRTPEVFHLFEPTHKRVIDIESISEFRSSRACSIDVLDEESRHAVDTRMSCKGRSRSGTGTLPTVEEAPERPITPLLPMKRTSVARSWGEEWKYTDKVGEKRVAKADSAISGLSSSSSAYTLSDRSSEGAAPRRQKRPRVVSPSSSIGNLGKRSPLSTMRSVEFLDALVRPDLRYCPPNIPPPHEWNPARTASLTQLLPVADIDGFRRRSSIYPAPCLVRRPTQNLPPLTRQRMRNSQPPMRRRTIDCKVPGEFRLSIEQERKVEEHAKKIEVMSIERSKSDSGTKPPTPPKDPAKRIPKRHVPFWSPFFQVVNSKSRYRERRAVSVPEKPVEEPEQESPKSYSKPFFELAAESLDIQAEIERLPSLEQIPSMVSVVSIPRVRPLRRLSLGDIETGFGRVFDE